MGNNTLLPFLFHSFHLLSSCVPPLEVRPPSLLGGIYAAGRCSPQSGPRGRTSHAAPGNSRPATSRHFRRPFRCANTGVGNQAPGKPENNPEHTVFEGGIYTGVAQWRAPDSKSGGWGNRAFHPCQGVRSPELFSTNFPQRPPVAAGGIYIASVRMRAAAIPKRKPPHEGAE